MSGTFIEAHIADIHFGAIDPSLQYNILKEQFTEYLRQMQILDIVSINGDIFDHKFLANSDAVLYANMFVQDLVNICKEKDATLIIIGGTASHDAFQLKLFYHYIGQCDIRIIETVQFINVRNKNILIIPELYNKGIEYYSDFLYNSGYLYDACYMHGTYKGSVFGKDIEDLNSSREPTFSMNNFIGCKGPIISGHVHKPSCFDNHFYYCGSPYRWKFGEEEDKGFLILCHDIYSRKYVVHFEPIQSFRYDTINLDCMLNSDPHKVIEFIKNKQASGIDNIRIQFTKNNENLIPVLQSYYRNNGSVKIDANFKKEEILEESNAMSDVYKQYDFIFDKSASPYDILAKYINTKENSVFITSEDLIKLIEEEL